MIFYIEKQTISKEWNDNLSKGDLLAVFDSLPARSREGMQHEVMEYRAGWQGWY